MELEFQKTPIRYLATAIQEVKNTEVTQELRLPDGMPDIGRILTTNAQVLLQSKEWDRDRITAAGKVIVSTLYAPEDGTEPRSVDTWIPFQIRWDGASVDREGPMEILPLLRSVDSRSLSSRKMMVRASVSAMLRGYEERETLLYFPEKVPEDVQLLENTYSMMIPVEAGEKTVLLDEELMIPGAEKILWCTMNPVVTEQRVHANQVVFKGCGKLHVLYRDEMLELRNWNGEVDFSQLAQLEGDPDTECQVAVQMAVTSWKWDFSDGGRLRVKASMVGQYLVHGQRSVRVVQEAYSPRRTVEASLEQLEIPAQLDARSELLSTEALLPGVMGQGIDGRFYPDFPHQKWTTSGIELEIPGVFQTLIQEENGLQGATGRWEGKLQIPTDERSNLTAVPQSTGFVRAVSGSDGLDLIGQMELSMQFSSLQQIPMVTALTVGELQELPDSRPSLVICSCREGSLWDLAKQYGSTVSAIRAANGLQGEPEDQRMLLIPVI